MSTIGSLMALFGQGGPSSYGDIAAQTASTRGQEANNETALLKLADLKRSQASEEVVMAAIQKDPDLARLFFGASALGGIGQGPGAAAAPPGGPPGAGPMTQQSVTPGQPPSAPQVVPVGQDLSRYANVSPQGGGPIPADVMAQTMPQVIPPQSTLASLGAQPQGGMAGPQSNPALEMARTNPRAAMMLQQQIQGQQDRQWQMQEKGLSNRIKVVDYLARMAQGATDQDSWKQFLEEADRVSPGSGGRLPPTYSKEARDRVVAQGFEAKETMTLQVAEMKARADQVRAGLAGRTDAVNTELEIMGLAPATVSARAQQGDPQATAQLAEATNRAEQRQVRISALQGTGQIVKGPTGEYIRIKPGTDQVEVIKAPGGEPLREKPSETEQKGATLANSVAAANKLATELEDKGYKPSVWEKGIDKLPFGLGNYVTSGEYQKYRQTVREFASAWLYGVSGAQITASEWENANQTFFPQPNEDKGAVELKRQRRAALVEQLQQQSGATGRTGTQGQGATGQTFNDADIAATMADPRMKGKTRQQVIDMLLAQKLTYKN